MCRGIAPSRKPEFVIVSHDGAPMSERDGAGEPVTMTGKRTVRAVEGTVSEFGEVIWTGVGVTVNVSVAAPSPWEPADST